MALFDFLFGKNRSSNHNVKPIRGRHLRLESLENRELLSVNPLGAISAFPVQDLICECASAVSYEDPGTPEATPQGAPYDWEDTFFLHSKPDSNFTIYLDFDGHVTTGTYWNNSYGSTITTPAFSLDDDPAFNNTELERIQYIWQRVAEDYAPFDVNVTTEEPALDRLINSGSGDTAWGVRVVIGGDNSWYGNAGGVAYRGSFSWDSDTPCFAFTVNLGRGSEKSIAEAVSHEVGHTLGLTHDGTSTEGYYEGDDDGVWAPIMGVGYYSQVVHWSKGEYEDANNQEDDLAIITGETTTASTPNGNGFTYRDDDHGNTWTAATALEIGASNSQLVGAGIIERNTDIDFFSFTLADRSTVDVTMTSGTRDINLDILAKLYDATGTVLATSNPEESLHADFSELLLAGTYYISIEGTGRGEYYTDYGSLGTYTIDLTSEIDFDPPEPPANFRSTGQTWNSVTLEWNDQPRLTGYTLEYRISGTEDWTPWPDAPDVTATSATITGLLSNTEYEFKLTAKSDYGTTESEVVKATTKVAPPVAPENFRSTAQTWDSVTLEWTGQPDLDEYVLEYRIVDADDWIIWPDAPDVTATQATITNLLPDTDYEFKLTATNEIGSESAETQASTKVLPPVAPENFRSTAQTWNSVTLEWNEQTDLDEYVLEYRIVGAEDWIIWPDAPDVTATGAVITGLFSSTDYEFKLTATNESGSESAETQATTKIAPPVAPANFRSTAQTWNSVTLEWTGQPGLDEYVLEYRIVGAEDWIIWPDAPGVTATSAVITGLLADTEYEFKLTATNEIGSESAETQATTKVTPPVAPANFRSTAQTWNSVTLEWNEQTGLDEYVLEYRIVGAQYWITWPNAPDVTATGAVITGLLANTDYEFKLTATNESGTESAETQATTKISPPVAPANFRSTAQTWNSVTLEWAEQTGLGEYVLEYRIVGAENWTIWSPAPNVTATGAVITGLLSNTEYEFKLTATNESGSESSETQATTKVAPPVAPVNFRCIKQTTNSVTLGWNEQTDLDEYVLEYRLAGAENWITWSPAPGVTATSATITGLLADTEYEFKLTATNEIGSESAETKAITTVVPPVAPVNFRSTAQTWNSVTLEWNEQTGLDKYILEYRLAGAQNWSTWSNALDVTTTSATITGLLAKTEYEFKLTATNEVGSESAETKTTTKVVPPTAPENFRCTIQAADSVTLGWNEQTGLDEYVLEYRLVGGGNWITWPGVLNVAATNVTITDLLSNTEYEFKLTATNESGSASAETKATTIIVAPTTPTNFRSTNRTVTSVTLAWNEQIDADSYVLQYQEAGTGSNTTITVVGNFVTVTDLKPDTEYTFRLAAENTVGTSSPAVMSVATLAPPKPTGFTGTGQTATTVDLEWDPQEGVNGYTLRYKTLVETDWTTWTPTIDGTATNVTVTDLVSNTTYTFELTAQYATGNSEPAVTVAITEAKPNAPVATAKYEEGIGVTISWAPVPGAETYKVYHWDNGGWKSISVPNFTGLSITDRAGTATTQYGIRAYIGTHYSEMTYVSAEPIGKPDAPKNFEATDSGNSVTLTWDRVSGANTYQIWRWDIAKSDWVTVAKDLTGTSYVDSNPELGSGTYIIKARNAVGYGDLATASTTTKKPEVPKDFTATLDGDVVNLSWSLAERADSYQVWRWDIAKSDWVTVAKDITGTSYVDLKPELGSGTYIIKARNTVGYSDLATASTKTAKPDVPKNFTATPDGDVVNLSWSPAERADSYQVWRWDPAKSDWVTVAKDITGTSCVDKEPVPDSGTYIIKARNAVGYSDLATASTSTREPEIPKYFTATLDSGVVNLSWSPAERADSYQVWRWDIAKSDWVTVEKNITGTSCVDKEPGLGSGVYLLKALNGNGYSGSTSASVFSTPIVTANYLADTTVKLE